VASERSKVDVNFKAGGVVGGYSSADAIGASSPTIIILRIDPTTGRLLVDSNTGGDPIADGDAYAAGTEGILSFGTDGSNYYPLLTDNTGALQVVTTASDEDIDDDSIAKEQTLPLIINENYVFSKTDNAWIRMQASTDGYLFTRPIGIYDSAGHELAIEADGDINVNVASIITGVGATNLGKAEDATHASGDVGVMALGVENEDQADLSTGDKDYTPIAVTKEGNIIVKQEGTVTVDSELPAAIALADDIANPTAPAVGAYLMGFTGGGWRRIWGFAADDASGNEAGLVTLGYNMNWNGATWSRMKGDTTDGVLVNLGANNDVSVLPLSSIYNNTKTVPTGTAEAITTTQAISSVTVKALSTNTVPTYVGGTGVTTTTGFELLAGESVSLDISDLATVFVISGSADQVVRYIGI